MKEQVVSALEEIALGLKMDGGGIELVDVNEETGNVQVKLTGACHGCPHAQATMKTFVERRLKELVEGVNEVENLNA